MVYYPAGPSADYDADGRVDLFLVNWFSGNHSRLLHNDSAPRQWLKVRVVGKTINRMGIGSQIAVYRTGRLGEPSGLLGYQELSIGYGYSSGQPAECHFGLGNVELVDVRVMLPNGTVIDRRDVAAGSTLVVEEE